jgi:aminoglycoside 2''-phosphotransferase
MQDIKKLIEGEFPDFCVHSIEKLGEGLRNAAFLVNQNYVFRFAKCETASMEMKKEAAVLPYLHQCISVDIPRIKYFSSSSDGLFFAGYPLLSGILLDEDGVGKLEINVRKSLALQLSQFISELRSFHVSEATRLGTPVFDLKIYFSKLLDEVKRYVFPLVDKKMQKYVASRFDAYLNTPRYFSYTPLLVHGDLSPNHYILDSDTCNLSGIIDFGDLCVTDPDYEYVYILEDGGEEFTRDVLKGCGHKDLETTIEKVSLFVTFDHLRYVMEGVRRNDEAWILEGISALKEEMKR